MNRVKNYPETVLTTVFILFQGEAEALISASRCYLRAEESINDLGCPSFEENLTSCIQTYNHAIRLLSEKGDHFR